MHTAALCSQRHRISGAQDISASRRCLFGSELMFAALYCRVRPERRF